jgi:hypothetical protein
MPNRRTALAVAGWVAAAVVATLVGVGALRLVGESISGTPGGVLSQEQVGRELARSPSPGPTSAPAQPATPTPSATASPSGPAAVQKGFRARGGSVVAECRGTLAWLVSWAPAPGFGEHEVDRGPAAEAEVDFRGPAGRSKIKVRCAGGQPVAEVDED